MTQENQITVRFKAAGHKELKRAILELAKAQSELQRETARYKRLSKELQEMNAFGVKNNRLLGGSFATLRSKMLLASFAAGIVAGTFGKLFQAAAEQEQAEIKLANAIGFTSKTLLEHASAMQQVTQFGDEVVLNAQAMIASFIKDEEVVKTLTEATADLAAAKGLDLASAADLVAKSVGSSTNSLSRYGIAADGAAKSTERAESVARNISVLYGGQAKAQADSYAGTITGMTNALGDAAEAFGDLIAPAVIVFSNTVKNMSNIVENAIDGIRGITVAVDNFFFGMVSLRDVSQPVRKELGSFQSQLADMTSNELEDQFNAINNMIGNYEDLNKGVKESGDEYDNLRKTYHAVSDATSTLQNGNSGLIATNEATINSIATLANEEKKLELIQQEKARRSAFAQELFAKTTESQKQATEGMLEWVRSNKLAFASEEEHLAVLKMLENQLKKNGSVEAKETEKRLKNYGKIAGGLASLNTAMGGSMRATIRLQQVQAMVDAYAGAQSGWAMNKKAFPFPIPELLYAADIATGLAQARALSKAAGDKFEQGGLVGGRRHSQGGTMIEAERGEFVMSRNAVQAVGVEAMNRINQGGGAGSVNITFNSPVMSAEHTEDVIIPQIKEAIRRGADIGVS